MIRSSVFSLLAAIVLLGAASPARASAESALSQRADAFYRQEAEGASLPYREKVASVTAGYEALSAGWGSDLASVAIEDLDSMFRAAYLVSFYTFDPRDAARLRAMFDELARRGLDSPGQRAQMHQALVGARMLDEASAFAQAYPAERIEALPAFAAKPGAQKPGPSEWLVSAEEKKLVLAAADSRAGAQIVVVSHPNCHFSQAAVRDIYADPALAKAFEGHSKWLAPQSGKIDFDTMQQWNREHPQAPVSLAYRQTDWPLLDYWGTPTFYVVKDGKLEAKVTGWSQERKKAMLEDALRKVGLL